MAEKLADIVDRMIVAGKSDDDIRFIIATDPSTLKAKQDQLKAANAKPLNEPTSWLGGAIKGWQSWGHMTPKQAAPEMARAGKEYAKGVALAVPDTLMGLGKGGLRIAEAAMDPKQAYQDVSEGVSNFAAHPGESVRDTVLDVATNPRAIGNIVGLGGLPDIAGALPASVPSAIRQGVAATGRALEKAGDSNAVKYGVPGVAAADAVLRGNPSEALLLAGLPLASRKLGQTMQKAEPAELARVRIAGKLADEMGLARSAPDATMAGYPNTAVLDRRAPVSVNPAMEKAGPRNLQDLNDQLGLSRQNTATDMLKSGYAEPPAAATFDERGPLGTSVGEQDAAFTGRAADAPYRESAESVRSRNAAQAADALGVSDVAPEMFGSGAAADRRLPVDVPAELPQQNINDLPLWRQMQMMQDSAVAQDAASGSTRSQTPPHTPTPKPAKPAKPSAAVAPTMPTVRSSPASTPAVEDYTAKLGPEHLSHGRGGGSPMSEADQAAMLEALMRPGVENNLVNYGWQWLPDLYR